MQKKLQMITKYHLKSNYEKNKKKHHNDVRRLQKKYSSENIRAKKEWLKAQVCSICRTNRYALVIRRDKLYVGSNAFSKTIDYINALKCATIVCQRCLGIEAANKRLSKPN